MSEFLVPSVGPSVHGTQKFYFRHVIRRRTIPEEIFSKNMYLLIIIPIRRDQHACFRKFKLITHKCAHGGSKGSICAPEHFFGL